MSPITRSTLTNDCAVCTCLYCRQRTGNVYCIVLAPYTRTQSAGLSHLRAMLQSYHELQPMSKTIPKFKAALHLTRESNNQSCRERCPSSTHFVYHATEFSCVSNAISFPLFLNFAITDTVVASSVNCFFLTLILSAFWQLKWHICFFTAETPEISWVISTGHVHSSCSQASKTSNVKTSNIYQTWHRILPSYTNF